MRAALLLAILLAPVAASLPPAAAVCPGFQIVSGQGPSCPVPGGWEVLLRDGSRIFTHGPDRVDGNPPPLTSPPPPQEPYCTTQIPQWGLRVVYAYPADKTDQSAVKAPAIRDMVRQVNGLVRAESAARGDEADLRVYCRNGMIDIIPIRLRTASNQDSFSTIISDIRSVGLNGNSQKYWVYYDDTVDCACVGQANFYQDDTLSPVNQNNSPSGSSQTTTFAVLYSTIDPGVAAHEIFHVMGAVQRSAPHATLANHCTDGLDVMCWEDGSGGYSTLACPVRTALDCNGDDWFGPYPPRGSYLATHWNVGSHLNKFIEWSAERDPPQVTWLAPTAGWIHEGCAQASEWVPGRAALRRDGCIHLRIDDASDIARVELRVGGVLTAVDESGNPDPVYLFPVTRVQMGTLVTLDLYDRWGNYVALSRQVDMLRL